MNRLLTMLLAVRFGVDGRLRARHNRGSVTTEYVLWAVAVIAIVINNEQQWTGGPDGMAVPAFELFGKAVAGEGAWYAVAAGMLVVMTWLWLSAAIVLLGAQLNYELNAGKQQKT